MEIRSSTTSDASQIWELVRETGVLDCNSAYLYLLLCRDFSETCFVACRHGRVVGAVTGYRIPSDPSVLFIWQIGVAPNAKRQGIALRLLRELIEQNAQYLTAIEATVSPSNVASQRLFGSLAEAYGSSVINLPDGGFTEKHFPPGDHEAEPRIRIELLGERLSHQEAARPEHRPAATNTNTTNTPVEN